MTSMGTLKNSASDSMRTRSAGLVCHRATARAQADEGGREELLRLRREVRELRMEREALKHAAHHSIVIFGNLASSKYIPIRKETSIAARVPGGKPYRE